MGIADAVFDAITGIRRWWWRHKWSSLDVPAEEWTKLDGMIEDLNALLVNVKSLQKLIMDASTLRAGHGMSIRSVWSDLTGKQHDVDIVLDGAGATNTLMEGYCKEIDARRREMLKIAVEMSHWALENTAPIVYEVHTPLHNRIADAFREAVRIAREVSAESKGRTASEFLRYALLDEAARQKRLAPNPERAKLEKPEEKPKPPPEEKPRKKSGDNDRRRIWAVLLETCNSFGVSAQSAGFTAAHAVTRYRLKLEKGTKISKAISVAPEIASSLKVDKVSISAAPDEERIIYVDVPNKDVEPLLYADAPRKEGKFFVGEGIDGKPVFADMEELCHVLIAGTTGSGKSVFLNTLICSMIRDNTYHEVRFIMIDPKVVELTPYNGIPHLERPVITDETDAVEALDGVVKTMNERYKTFSEIGVKKLSEYNVKSAAPFPRLVIVIDELADLMMASDREVEDSIMRIAQKGRAAGIHLIIATQRPTVDIVTGNIKNNVPSRIAFSMPSANDSRIILGEKGAETLCGNGDMIYKPVDGKAKRLQGAYIEPEEIERIVNEVKRY